ncbi:MAG TPA: NAD(P)-dependent oxidoreductase [Candidatus Binatia bacterium]|nr:NAD(P)-dependent oxidoreductase [Candidatus Binatia bacterium]
MKVLHQIRDTLAAQVAAAVPDVDVIAIPRDSDLPAGVTGEVLLTYPWAAPNLSIVLAHGVRWIHALGTGVDAFPFDLLTDQTLTCSRGGSAIPIAEWVLAVTLAFEKRLPESWIHAVPEGGWSRADLGTLHDKTLGLVGLGGIGTAVARLALPFGMKVQAYRRTTAPATLDGIAMSRSLSELVAVADHIVIAAPATRQTRHLLNREIFSVMKFGAHVINISRGSLIDADALRAALDNGRVAMASLDAVEPEPLPAGHWMYTHPRVRLSPHVSWSMPGAAERLIDPFIDNLRRYRAGQPLFGVVDREVGY